MGYTDARAPSGEEATAVNVSDILAAKGSAVETIGPGATIERAAQRLRTAHLGALVVSTDGTHLNGVITERDIVYGLGKHGGALLDMRVDQLMRRGGPTWSPRDTLQQLMAQMTRLRVRHVPVVHDGELVGIVSIGDVVKHRLDELEAEARTLHDYLQLGR